MSDNFHEVLQDLNVADARRQTVMDRVISDQSQLTALDKTVRDLCDKLANNIWTNMVDMVRANMSLEIGDKVINNVANLGRNYQNGMQ